MLLKTACYRSNCLRPEFQWYRRLDGKNHDLVSNPFGHGKEASIWIESDVGIAKVSPPDRC